MTSFAPILQAFLTDHLMTQRRVSPNTVAAYRDTFKLLLRFAQTRIGTPSAVDAGRRRSASRIAAGR